MPLERVACLVPEQGVLLGQAELVTSGHVNIRDSLQREEKSLGGRRDEGRRGAAGLAWPPSVPAWGCFVAAWPLPPGSAAPPLLGPRPSALVTHTL